MTFALDLDVVSTLAQDRPWHGLQVPNPAFVLREQPPLTLLAMCLWGEARSEGPLGMLLAGCVVRNRVERHSERYGYGWIGVLTRPKQFSCFNVDDRNFSLLRHPQRYDSLDVWTDCCNAA